MDFMKTIAKMVLSEKTNIISYCKNITSLFSSESLFKRPKKIIINNEKSLKSYIEAYKDKKGIYIFLLSKDFNCMPSFDDDDYSAKRNKINNDLPSKFLSNNDNPLYIGKTYDLSDRLKEHYSNTNGSTTYSLKLLSNNRYDSIYNTPLRDNCYVLFFELKKKHSKTIGCVKEQEIWIPLIESALHKDWKPYIGTKRK